MITFGIIGCGNIAAVHAEAIREIAEAKLVAVCDSDREKGRLFGK
jgi:UDP-N-acetyl-2-amino-2-deoxyglucuronate dehydrogenase